VLGLITAAGGGLTLNDLEELTERPPFEIEHLLGGLFGRSVGSRTQPPAVGRGEERVYLFAHETLRHVAQQQFGNILAAYRDRLHTWADTWRDRRWPTDTPQYLLRSYPRMLVSTEDLTRLLACATDQVRHDRMRDLTGGDALAFTEISTAQQLILAQPDPDLVSLALLAVQREHLTDRNSNIPVELPAVWARIGQPNRAEALANSIPDPQRRAHVIAQLVEVVAASGDNGSSACVDSHDQLVDQLAVSYPASSPWVTSVGGTNFTLAAANTIQQQVVWNDAPAALAAGGGGFSDVFARPSYQQRVVGGARRAVPDVAMLADLEPGYAVFCTAADDPTCADAPSWHSVGGTSAASPLLAGGAALVDQDLHRHAREMLGFMNPLLYGIYSTSQRASVFSDVITGGNDLGPYILDGALRPLGCCSARVGFDAASGLGSIDLAALDLVAQGSLPRSGNLTVAIPRSQRPIRARSLRVKLHCSLPCRAYAFAVVTIGSGDDFSAKSAVHGFRGAGTQTVSIPFSSRQLRSMRSGLAQRQRIEAEVFAVAIDAGPCLDCLRSGEAVIGGVLLGLILAAGTTQIISPTSDGLGSPTLIWVVGAALFGLTLAVVAVSLPAWAQVRRVTVAAAWMAAGRPRCSTRWRHFSPRSAPATDLRRRRRCFAPCCQALGPSLRSLCARIRAPLRR